MWVWANGVVAINVVATMVVGGSYCDSGGGVV